MTLGCIAGALAFWAAANAPAVEAGENPYQGIVVRNVFGLKDPPPPPRPEDNKPPPPRIMLQGITTILGNKRVLMKVATPPKPGVKPEEQSLILAAGQRDGDIEVLEIDEKAGTVKVNNFGTITNLNFQDHGVKLASAPPPGAAPAGVRPGVPGAVPPPPGVPGAAPAASGAHYQPRTVPMNRIPRTSSTGTSGRYSAAARATQTSAYTAVPTPQPYGAVPGFTAPTTTATPGTVALGGLGVPASTPKPQQNWPPETPMTPEQAAIMEAAYSLKYQKEISQGIMPPIPGGNPILDADNAAGQDKPPSNF